MQQPMSHRFTLTNFNDITFGGFDIKLKNNQKSGFTLTRIIPTIAPLSLIEAKKIG